MEALKEQTTGTFVTDERSNGTNGLKVVGCWTIAHANEIYKNLSEITEIEGTEVELSLRELGQLDTSGAWLLCRLKDEVAQKGTTLRFTDLSDEHHVLLNAIEEAKNAVTDLQPQKIRIAGLFSFLLNKIAAGIDEVLLITSLLGELSAAFLRALNPFKFRFAAVTTHMMRTGLTAVPIISLMSFVIGAIIAQQGAYQLSFFGADVMAVDFVSVLVTRDLGVLLTAIMVAGRSGSAYTAEIGSMKMREEIDALKVIGLNPVDVLLFPRILALVLVLPLLTIIADYAALFGAQFALWIYIDLSWEVFLDRARDITPDYYFTLGVVKAPFMALIIGLIAMSEGLKVAGSSESLSHHTTVSVVKSIFLVIVVDGIFAVISASLGA